MRLLKRLTDPERERNYQLLEQTRHRLTHVEKRLSYVETQVRVLRRGT